jgi:hypothetical protein
MSRRRALSNDQVRELREWKATPVRERRRTLEGMAAVMGITYHLAWRATYRQGAYAKVNP